MFGLTTFTNWLETTKFFGSITRQQVRYARRLGRVYNLSVGRYRAIDGAMQSGEHDKIRKAFKNYHSVMKRMVDGLELEVKDFRAEIVRIISEEKGVLLQAQHAKEPDQKVIQDVNEGLKAAAKAANDFLGQLGSFESINLSSQQLVDRASQIRQMYYDFVKSRKADTRLKKELKTIEKDEHAGSAAKDERIADKSLEDERELLHDETAAIGIAFLLLQEIRADLAKRKEFIHKEVVPVAKGGEGYPEGWATDNIKQLDDLDTRITGFVQKEIEESRIWLSNAERAQASVRI